LEFESLFWWRVWKCCQKRMSNGRNLQNQAWGLIYGFVFHLYFMDNSKHKPTLLIGWLWCNLVSNIIQKVFLFREGILGSLYNCILLEDSLTLNRNWQQDQQKSIHISIDIVFNNFGPCSKMASASCNSNLYQRNIFRSGSMSQFSFAQQWETSVRFFGSDKQQLFESNSAWNKKDFCEIIRRQFKLNSVMAFWNCSIGCCARKKLISYLEFCKLLLRG
jgi:hypothetical protein